MSENTKTINPAEELVRRALAEHQSALIGYATSILGDSGRAQDAVQDTFLKLWHQEPGAVNKSLKSWLFTVCRNRSFDILRKEKRMTHMETSQLEGFAGAAVADDPAEDAERSDRHSALMNQLERLPENQREVIRLKFQHDLSYREISAITNLSESNIGFLIHTGIKNLRKKLVPQQAS